MEGDGCVDDNVAGLFTTGALSHEERKRIEEHLDRCTGCRRLLGELSRQSGVTPGGGPALLAAGTQVGRYEIESVVGAGAMGVVYAARDSQLARRVALKLLRPVVVEDEEARRRLVQEALTLARLSHQNIVTIHDSGEWHDQVFVAMELVDGGTLSDWLWKESPPLTEVLRVFRAVGEGLAAAHAAGVVHRDVKPDNVLLGGDGRARVTDFGLARGPGEGGGPGSPAAASFRTESGTLLGTPAYMAPEQRAGKPADPRSDQYSFAVSLWEAVTGGLPSRQGMPARSGAPAPRPLPRRIRHALERAMAEDPDARWPSMEALVAALAWDPAARRRGLVTAAVSLCAIVGAGVVAWRSHARLAPCAAGEERVGRVLSPARLGRLRDEAARLRASSGPFAAEEALRARRLWELLDDYRAQWIAMYSDSCSATRVRGDQSEELLELRMSCLDTRLAGADVLAGLLERGDPAIAERLAQREVLEPLAACADRAALLQPIRPPKDAATRARVQALRERIARAAATDRAGEYKAARALASPLVADARALGYGPILADALYMVAALDEHESDFPTAERDYREAALTAEAARYDHLAARARASLAYLVVAREDRAAGGRALLAEADAARARIGDAPEIEARLDEVRGEIASKENKPDEALALFGRALALIERTKGERSLAAARLQVNLGVELMFSRPVEARAQLERGLASEAALLGPHHPMVLVARADLVDLLLNAGHVAEARAEVAELLALREAALGPEHEEVANTLRMQAEVAMSQPSTRAEAPPLMERALAILRKRLPPEHFRLTEAEGFLAETLLNVGRLDESLRHSTAVLASVEARPGPGQVWLVQTLTIHGETLLRLGRAAEARPELERALTLSLAVNDPRRTAENRFELAKALWALGQDRARARSLVRTAEQELVSQPIPDDEKLREVRAWTAKHRG